MWANSLTLILFSTLVSSTISFKDRSTEKPVPFESNPMTPKKPHTHISEFTDPDTGLNPFLDLEEGPTSVGRNVMKDSGSHDPSSLDFEPVEGGTSGRNWAPSLSEWPSVKWSPYDDNFKDELPITTSSPVSQDVPTTMGVWITFTDEIPDLHYDEQEEDEEMKKDDALSNIQQRIIYASAAMAVIATVSILVGACWWRRKLKRTVHSAVTVECPELKS
ncbi:hypothetical protein X975_16377, partial [Stegodyphus mimosarum]